jgi:large subunit ribosomal protein L30
MAKEFKVTLKKSTIGQNRRQRDGVRCLGLRKIGQHVMIKDNPANRGQIFKIQHLLNVEVVK